MAIAVIQRVCTLQPAVKVNAAKQRTMSLGSLAFERLYSKERLTMHLVH